ncbi:MAG: hypothetical protein R2712_30015 [Vicinamibacterales bacterium]
MTYMHEGKQYIVIAIGGGVYSGELLAFKLPGWICMPRTAHWPSTARDACAMGPASHADHRVSLHGL